MRETKSDIAQSIMGIVNSGLVADKKLEALNDILGKLNQAEYGEEVILLCDQGILIAEKIQRTDMLAQLHLIRAKAVIAKAGPLIHEMKNIKMALSWFEFALERERIMYKALDYQVNMLWKDTQASMDKGLYYLKQKPYTGVVAYCYKSEGEIYGQFYLQLRLYHFNPGKPWKSRIANLKLVRFLGVDDFILLNRDQRKRVISTRVDCCRFFKRAIRLFKKEGVNDFLADCYLTFAIEHQTFNNPFRKKFYLYKASRLIKKHSITHLLGGLESVRDAPFIGSKRD